MPLYVTSGSAQSSIYCYSLCASTSASMYDNQLYQFTAATWGRAGHYNRAALDRSQRDFDAQHRAASIRSLMLLMRRLTPEQRRTMRKNKWFMVTGGKTGTRYRINTRGSICANVDVLADNNERVVHKLCAHAQAATVPTGDQLLTQKIMLEWAEDEFLARANRHAA